MHTTFDSPPTAIAILEKIRHALVETTDLARIKALRDEAESVRQYAVTTALGLGSTTPKRPATGSGKRTARC